MLECLLNTVFAKRTRYMNVPATTQKLKTRIIGFNVILKCKA